jgi:hypothetical protein
MSLSAAEEEITAPQIANIVRQDAEVTSTVGPASLTMASIWLSLKRCSGLSGRRSTPYYPMASCLKMLDTFRDRVYADYGCWQNGGN